jgi:hypothetical protein
LANGILSLRADGCTCRAWALADVDIAHERSMIETRQAEAEEYCHVVARWNAQVMNATPARTFDFPAFCAYLLEAYDAMVMDAAGVRHE